MTKKQQNTKNAAAETSKTAVIDAPVNAPDGPTTEAPEAPATADVPTPKVARTAKPIDPRTFTLTSTEFKPGAGLAAALHAELRQAPGTVADLTNRLLASGVYEKCAPQAAKLRPMKPVETLLKLWLAKGAVTAS